MDIVDGGGAYVPLKTLNFDTAYVTVTVNAYTYFDVVAENGITRITYQFKPQSSAGDAFVLSDIYLVAQRDFLIEFVPRGTNVQTFLSNLVPSFGATIKLVDKMGYERTDGMLADQFVYALSLWAVGLTVIRKKKVARLSGYFQLTLAFLGIFEVIRKFIGFEAIPNYRLMIIVSFFALIGNAACLYLLQKSKSKEAHMKASMIFTSNDIIINAGVIVAGILVVLTQSKYPDLIVGSIVFLIVVRGAIRILRLGKN